MAVHHPGSTPYDTVITGGLLADPESGSVSPGEVALREGRIAHTGPPGTFPETTDTASTWEVPEWIVAPGLIDLHTHVFPGRTELGLTADTAGVRQAVTTVADAGSCGSDHWPQFAEQVVSASATRVLSWLNISRHGLVQGHCELAGGAADIDTAATAGILRTHGSTVRGIKVRMSRSVLGESGLAPLRAAKRLAGELSTELGRAVPVMVHVGNGPPAFGDILDLLGPGDVVTHAFHGKPGGLFDPSAASPKGLLPQARSALSRGVRFDVGHGSASFSFATAGWALAAGVRPHTASTDLHQRNRQSPVGSLCDTLSKLLALGMPLSEVLACATSRPAELLGCGGQLGTLRPGAVADLSVLELREECRPLTDAMGDIRQSAQQLVPHAAVRNGRVYSADSVQAAA